MRGAGLSAARPAARPDGFVLWFAEPVRHDMHGLPGILAGAAGLVLVALAAVRARVYDDRASAVALGLAALPLLLIAGSGILGPDAGDEGPGRLQFLLGCVAVLVAAVLLALTAQRRRARSWRPPSWPASAPLATFVAILTDAAPRETAAVAAVVAVGLVGFLPGWSARFARLPIGFGSPEPGPPTASSATATGRERGARVDADRIAAQARRGHEMLLGLVGGCSAAVVGSAARARLLRQLLGAQLLALAAGLATLLRARLFRYTSQVACAAGRRHARHRRCWSSASALNPPADVLTDLLRGNHGPLDLRTVWLTAAVAAGAALLVADRPDRPAQGRLPLLGPAARPRRGRRPALPRPAVPGGARRVRRGPRHDQRLSAGPGPRGPDPPAERPDDRTGPWVYCVTDVSAHAR